VRWLPDAPARRATTAPAPSGSARSGSAAGAESSPEDRLGTLTARERQIALIAGGGTKTGTIARQLGVSPRTVDVHLSRIYRKLGVPGRAGLVAIVARLPPAGSTPAPAAPEPAEVEIAEVGTAGIGVADIGIVGAAGFAVPPAVVPDADPGSDALPGRHGGVFRVSHSRPEDLGQEVAESRVESVAVDWARGPHRRTP
jgi:DNA-binding CsgD family transcriptional regulator